jgi:hypothetical protein
VTTGSTTLARKLALLTARLRVSTADWVHAVGDGLDGRLWEHAFGPRWALATSGEDAGSGASDKTLEPMAVRLLGLVRAVAWPVPKVALLRTLGASPQVFGRALRNLLDRDLVTEADGVVRAVGATRTHPFELIEHESWREGESCLEGLARLPWAIASGNREEALSVLSELRPADADARALDEALVLRTVADPLRGEPSFERLHTSWREALEPTAPADPSGSSMDPIILIYVAGRLSEARARAEALLLRSHRVADRVAARLVLAATLEALGLGALARVHREAAEDESSDTPALAFEVPSVGVPSHELDAALARGDDAAAVAWVARVGACLDAHDRYTMNLRPELVALRFRTTPRSIRGRDE